MRVSVLSNVDINNVYRIWNMPLRWLFNKLQWNVIFG